MSDGSDVHDGPCTSSNPCPQCRRWLDAGGLVSFAGDTVGGQRQPGPRLGDLLPQLDDRCRCGHAWGEHRLTTTGCNVCPCEAFAPAPAFDPQEALGRVTRQARHVAACRDAWDVTKDRAADAKKVWEAAVARLEQLIADVDRQATADPL